MLTQKFIWWFWISTLVPVFSSSIFLLQIQLLILLLIACCNHTSLPLQAESHQRSAMSFLGHSSGITDISWSELPQCNMMGNPPLLLLTMYHFDWQKTNPDEYTFLIYRKCTHANSPNQSLWCCNPALRQSYSVLKREYLFITSCPSNLTWVLFQQVCPKAIRATLKYLVAINRPFTLSISWTVKLWCANQGKS